MSTAEIKLDLFRKIDNLNDAELEKIYDVFLTLLYSHEKHMLADMERKAIQEALDGSKQDEVFSHESVMNEAKQKYPQLKFK
jgi:hypothetical protein